MAELDNLSALSCASRTLKQEILGFDFNYPLEIDSAAGPRDSLRYYLYSDKLSWETLRMDSAGIPRAWVRVTGTNYWPGFIAWYALVQLGHYLRGKGAQHLDSFLKQIDWLENHAVLRGDGAVVWPMNFDNPENEVLLRAPWISSHAQGLAISAVLRGWRVTKRPHLRELLEKAWLPFDLDVSQGGIRARVNGASFYTEVPGGAVPGILDGFMTSLLGLYDLYTEFEDEEVGRLLRAGIAGLKQLLPYWNYRQKWSWYGARQYLCSPAYHCLNRLLLATLGALTGDLEFKQCAERWNPANRSFLERTEIYLGFVITKNLARIRHRTWLQKTACPPSAIPTSGVQHT
ncbi:MAG TPA: D-glucuronyl C5-epimerase family protein [Bryobacteraceae bacterium]|jgi:hypothetical protein|nr:D-glucuronyl C5-epimerase family protein [Bryobacteraceae bacterium]